MRFLHQLYQSWETKSWCNSCCFIYFLNAWIIFRFSYSIVYWITMRIIERIKFFTNTRSFHHLLQKVLHICLSSEIPLSLFIWRILFIFVPWYQMKNTLWLSKIFYSLLLCLALRCYGTSFFLSFLLCKNRTITILLFLAWLQTFCCINFTVYTL